MLDSNEEPVEFKPAKIDLIGLLGLQTLETEYEEGE